MSIISKSGSKPFSPGRRKFLMWMAAGAAGAAVGGGLIVKSCRRDLPAPLSQRMAEFGKDFIFSQKYMEQLMADGKVSRGEIDEIFSRYRGEESLYALMAYGLTKRILHNREVSRRYLGSVDAVSSLIKKSRIGFEYSPKLSLGDFIYRVKENKIYINPKTTSIRLVEASLLHELYHVFQDKETMAMRISMIEAEAHLVKSDFLYHAAPGLLHCSHWVQIFLGKNNKASAQFIVPTGLVQQALKPEQKQAELERIMTEIRKHWLITMIVNGALDPKVRDAIVEKTKWLSQERKLPYLKELTDKSYSVLNRKPLEDQVKCRELHIWVLPDWGSSMAECTFSDELKTFATAANIYWYFLLKLKEKKEAEAALNYYYVDIWKGKMDALIDNPQIDAATYFNGIR
ncbi:hypothetical protein AMJ44_04320 [candidate division WOR-1 bacterium DG_54_3]|uniref:Uncharacterized protein n=1 Tax=candidate division WOR-1 bacterium DG_54_3 TaxID=1703775 RepID=A0A0S7Y3D3_UNCSA|nr:MAG: hypothetical protein AMJ44_04320 [candidate division WOR-1 bacterium DG_54_3]